MIFINQLDLTSAIFIGFDASEYKLGSLAIA